MNQRYAVLACAFLWATLTWAQESSSNGDVLEAVFDNYTTSGTKEQTSQLLEAIAASPLLAGQLHELAAAHLFSGIKVVVATPPVGPPFAGLTKGSTIVLTGKLLAALRQSRRFDVVRADDVLPNQTVFVLAHLAQHLRTAGAMQAAMKSAQTPDAYANIRLQDEAVAFIDAWNVTVDAATHGNNDVPLTPPQVASVFVNLRYRFPFLSIGSKLSFIPSGKLATSDQNVEAVSETLKRSQMTDIE